MRQIGSSVEATNEFLFNRAARKSLDRLRELTAKTTYEVQDLTANFLPRMEGFLRNPTDEGWTELQAELADVMDGLDELAEHLEASSPTIAALPFFPIFVKSILTRRTMIKLLGSTPRPGSRNEEEVLYHFLRVYDHLLMSIVRANEELASHIGRIEGSHGPRR